MQGGLGCPITAVDGQITFLGMKRALIMFLFCSKDVVCNFTTGFSVQLVFGDSKLDLRGKKWYQLVFGDSKS
jgi:hypothetical protein